MERENCNLVALFSSWAETKPNTIVQLLNKDQIPVAALYLNKLKFESFSILKTNNLSEKYYIYFNGIAVFFTYYKKGEQHES